MDRPATDLLYNNQDPTPIPGSGTAQKTETSNQARTKTLLEMIQQQNGAIPSSNPTTNPPLTDTNPNEYSTRYIAEIGDLYKIITGRGPAHSDLNWLNIGAQLHVPSVEEVQSRYRELHPKSYDNFGIDNLLGKIRTTEDDPNLSEISYMNEFQKSRQEKCSELLQEGYTASI